ncbi:GntR family transcriptional regulator [Bradyrhizobium sp. 4]|jgi:DNA-binding GntR family transcriptional regulator|nr:GntR family transcriptional regulator [Bradyrhizobium sp. 39]MCK1753540.1 GntR family transcriptional regulator [Bradyrhizobium sp. 135]UPJ38740.1 GntR family transcriptional regulator [Bradyrhizobium sp. 4]
MGPLQFHMTGSPGDGPRSLTSALHERLRADILATRLLPGQKLHIAGLAKQFSVSLAAVREALSRLVADGLVLASDQRGFRVSPVSLADLADVTQTRIDIEGLALRRSIERGDDAWLASVKSAWADLKAVPYRYPDDPTVHYEEWVVRHRIFHRALVNACGSPWLLGFRDVLHEQSERYRRLSIRREVGKPRDVEAEHKAIVAAVVKRDADAAVRALAKHFGITKEFVELAAPRIAEVNGAN